MIIKITNIEEIKKYLLLVLNIEDIKTILNTQFNNLICYVVENKIVAYLEYSYIYERIEINNILVSNEYRNKKIASQLLEYLLKDPNILNITLEVRKSNTPAINLYKKYNFLPTTIRKNYYKEEDGILMMFEVKR